MLGNDIELRVKQATVTIEKQLGINEYPARAREVLKKCAIAIGNPDSYSFPVDAEWGRGFVVCGGLILTAAHSVSWSAEGEMAEGGKKYFATCLAYDSCERIFGEVVAVEPAADIAVLRSTEPLVHPGNKEKLERLSNSVGGGLKVNEVEREPLEWFDIHIFSHEGDWIDGKATQCTGDASTIYALTKAPIPRGTSGSPILDDAGLVCAVVSNSSERGIRNPIASRSFRLPLGYSDDNSTDGVHPRPCQALPVWVWNIVRESQNGWRPIPLRA
ncbi:MAG: trypsin-like peptidase domain-containing protein [Thermoguttaceae bacterium]